jgi:hypothetical protein
MSESDSRFEIELNALPYGHLLVLAVLALDGFGRLWFFIEV